MKPTGTAKTTGIRESLRMRQLLTTLVAEDRILGIGRSTVDTELPRRFGGWLARLLCSAPDGWNGNRRRGGLDAILKTSGELPGAFSKFDNGSRHAAADFRQVFRPKNHQRSQEDNHQVQRLKAKTHTKVLILVKL
jgi:hypothetical protein